MNNHNISPLQSLGYRLGLAWLWLKDCERRLADRAIAAGVPNADTVARVFFGVTKLGLLVGFACISYGLFFLIVVCLVMGWLNSEGSQESAPGFPYDMNGNHVGDPEYMHGLEDKW
jgi:hypothetical protein